MILTDSIQENSGQTVIIPIPWYPCDHQNKFDFFLMSSLSTIIVTKEEEGNYGILRL